MYEVPASVRAASQRSDELIKGLNGTPDEDDHDAESQDASDENTPKPDGASDKPQTDDPAKATPPGKELTDDFETKYRTLQGKYNAEIPRLNDQVRTLSQQIAELTDENTRLSKAGNNNNEGSKSDNGRLNMDAYGEYGDEFTAMAARVNQLIDENNALKEQVGSVWESQSKTDREKYMGHVATQVGQMGIDFNKLNSDPDFLTWLQETSPYTGRSRHVSLQAAESKLDVNATLGIFKEYIGASTPAKQQKQKLQTQQRPNFQPTHKPSGSDISPPMSKSERIWTRQDVNQMYRDKAAGKYYGRDADFKALEADMFAAQTEGRFH